MKDCNLKDMQERLEERAKYKMRYRGNLSDPFEWRTMLTWLHYAFIGLCILLTMACPPGPLSYISSALLFGNLLMLGFRNLLIKGFDHLLYPDRTDYTPKPIFGPAYQARAQQRYGEAIALLLETTHKFPNQAQSYSMLMEIYARDFFDWEQVNIIYQWGLNTITDKQELDILKQSYTLFIKGPKSRHVPAAKIKPTGEK